ncbi:species-specific tRNA processing [Turnera subulata]|uniref:Species-specific tRNA processing n=1 Tax=Turnera subulata TaxID=218843 RepID=A0A9Q0FKQ6_9ROSI|nr:species-specific tRNA processing [Turnera subulata]
MAVGVASSGGKSYPSKLNWYVFATCLCAGAGGLIFGYDIGISGGVTSMAPFLRKFFPSVYHKEILDTSTNQYCTFNNPLLTLFTSSLYLAALVASLFASWVTRAFGRRLSMFLGGLIFFAGGAINAFAQNIAMLIVGRILLGVGVGFSVQSIPLYVSEMAPPNHRGAFNIVFQLSITIGIFIANVVNYLFNKYVSGHLAWRLSLGGACVPALIITIAAYYLPNTPNSMLEKGQDKEAREMLKRIRGVDDNEVEQEFQDLVAARRAAKEVADRVGNAWKVIGQRKYRPQLILAVLIPAFQQLTGINVVMFYAPVLFKSIGLGSNASLVSAVVTGTINVLATVLSIALTDKKGRRFWFFLGGAQMFIFQALVAALIGWKFGTSGEVTNLPAWYSYLVVLFICIFVAGFAWSWGPLGWLVPSEIFQLEIRSAGQSIVASVNMLFTFIVAQLFLPLLCALKFGLFIFFAALIAVMTAFIFKYVPETNKIGIEQMQDVFKTHPTWKKYANDQDNGRLHNRRVDIV